MKRGADFSEHDYGLSYTEVARQLDFVILREGYRLSRDRLFTSHLNGFRALGTRIYAVYHFIYATDTAGAVREAESCLKNVKEAGLGKEVMVFADFEYDSVDQAAAKGISLGVGDINRIVLAFCRAVEEAGYKAGIYANEDYVQNVFYESTIAAYPLWYAGYDSDTANRPCLLWQYTSTGKLDGYAGETDMDYLLEDDTMTTVEKAISWMEALARDDSHGYDQAYRWGERGDYDCSSAVITAWKQAGVPLESTYTGNMRADMLRHGFVDVTGQALKRGDVLLNEVHHVAMYCGDGMEVEASVNERGTATGGQPGDQTGREMLIRSYRDYPWDCVLRYQSVEEVVCTFGVSTVKQGTVSSSARLLQTLLKGLGYTGIAGAGLSIDGDAGAHTDHAIREYQADHGLEVDGECGPATWRSIIGI